jgi:hypothetical protein
VRKPSVFPIVFWILPSQLVMMNQVLKGGQRLRIGRKMGGANPAALTKDKLTDIPGVVIPIGEDALKRSPVRVAHALAWRQPDTVVGPNRHHVPQMQLLQFADQSAAFSIEALCQHDLKMKVPLLHFLEEFHC